MKLTNLIKLTAVIPLVILLSSCVGQEPNDIAYVTALGIDKKDDEYVYTIQFANPTKISGGASEEGGKGGQIVENLSVGGNSIYSGINNANAILSKNLSLAHAKLVVVSEDVARDGLYDITDLLARNGEIRPDIYIAVAENSQEYILEIQPVIELNPAKYYQLTYEKNEFGGVARNSAVEYYFSNMTGNRDCVLPLAGTANTDGEESSENSVSESVSENKRYEDAEKYESDFENNGRNYLAGQAGLKIANKSETIGMAVFNADEYIGKLGSIETELYNILSGQIEENYIEFYSGQTSVPITLRINQKKKPDYDIDIDSKHVNIKVRLEGELMSLSKQYEEANSINYMEKELSQMMSETAENFINDVYDRDIDILGLKGKLKTKFLTWQQYNDYCENYSDKDWDISVEGDIVISGTSIVKYR